MKKLLVISVLTLLCFGCEPNLKPKKPNNLISEEMMTDVLYDMFILSSAKGVNRTKFEKVGLDPEQYILKKYRIDSLQFAESNNYYSYDIEAYKAIIENVKTKLSAEKERYTAIDEKEAEKNKLLKDSLKSVRQRFKANPNINKK